jgi:hypothetical protein
MLLLKTLDGVRPLTAQTDYRYPVGRWTKHLDPDKLRVCENGWGYHLTDPDHLVDFLGPDLYVAEPCPDHQLVTSPDHPDKWVTCRVRLTKVNGWDVWTVVGLAADFAAQVLPIWEAQYPNDLRPRQAIEAARSRDPWDARDAAGAAGDAAWAAGAAAWAARDAEAAAWAARAAEDAARAAWDAARAAARAAWAARDAEDAGAAAWAAEDAEAAARAARAAEDAARAARDAGRGWQVGRVREVLGGLGVPEV